jgi:predicted kinase
MKELIMMVGMPCSGKSTFIEKFSNKFNDYIVISTDNIIEGRAEKQGKTYNEIFKDEIKSATKEMNERLAQAIQNGDNIIWDQTNLTVKSRKSKLSGIPKDYQKVAMYVETDLKTIKDRNVRPGKIIPESVLDNMWGSIEVPSITEGFHAVLNTLIFKDRL